MNNKKKIWVTGSTGMVGQALKRLIISSETYNIIETKRSDLDQTNQNETNIWLKKNKPDIIVPIRLVARN